MSTQKLSGIFSMINFGASGTGKTTLKNQILYGNPKNEGTTRLLNYSLERKEILGKVFAVKIYDPAGQSKLAEVNKILLRNDPAIKWISGFTYIVDNSRENIIDPINMGEVREIIEIIRKNNPNSLATLLFNKMDISDRSVSDQDGEISKYIAESLGIKNLENKTEEFDRVYYCSAKYGTINHDETLSETLLKDIVKHEAKLNPELLN